ncbi:MAG: rhomboid family intramembrane serine protease [Proteobacteria bacterium]|nr:rhomboid family intramembrane serine protease [Pseudomonadota bacterium]
MLPLRDTIQNKNYPMVNTAIIVVNVLVFLIQMGQGPVMDKFVFFYGLVPAKFTHPALSTYFSTGEKFFSLFSFMFLHGGFLHLLGNMWSLYIFGDNVEDRLGHVKYLGFYLACGVGSGVVQLVFNLDSQIPTIGASGAIAGVMGAYILLYPHAKILTLIPILFIPWFVEIPAYFFLGLWFLLQILNAAGSHGQMAGIAWWAHIGGFIFGMILIKLIMNIPFPLKSEVVSRFTERKKTHRLQVVHPSGPPGDSNVYGTLVLAPYEALAGTHKMINVPWGFKNRLFRVAVQPKTREGSMLKLKGLGKITPEGGRGDLLLKVVFRF